MGAYGLLLANLNMIQKKRLADTSQYSQSDCASIIEKFCKILDNLIQLHRDNIAQILPVVLSIIYPLLDCFRYQGENATQKQIESFREEMRFPIIAPFVPLPVDTASTLARLLQSCASKPVETKSYYGKARHNADPDQEYVKKFERSIGHHVCYVVADFVRIDSDDLARFGPPTVRKALLPGVFSLLDIGDKYHQDMVMSALSSQGKAAFKKLHDLYLKTHKYRGKT